MELQPMLTAGQLESLLELALKTAKSAFLAVKDDLNHLRKVENDLKRDVKVVADNRIESFIIEELKKETHYPILTEESGIVSNEPDTKNYWWIVDPLDGSLNFSRRIPICCISIAFWKGMTPLFGVVYDFNHDELFYGIVGKGAWLNDIQIRTSSVTDSNQAVLCTGFPVSTDFSEGLLLNFVKEIREFKKIRLFGSAALSLAYVACGRVDAYRENDIKIWDVAAGVALVKAAGGIIRISPSESETILKVYASNQHLLK